MKENSTNASVMQQDGISSQSIVQRNHSKSTIRTTGGVINGMRWSMEGILILGRIFEQFGEFLRAVPKANILNKNNENSEYTHISAFNKDCHLLVESSRNRDSLYGYWLQQVNNSVDCSFLSECEECYSTMDSENCFGLNF